VALDIYEREQLIERGRILEKPLAEALSGLRDHPLVADVRAGLGFLAGIDLDPDARRDDPQIVLRWQRACRSSGVLVRPLGSGIAISPPLILGEDELTILADGITAGLDQISS